MLDSHLVFDTEFCMPPDWVPERPTVKTEPRRAQIFQAALVDVRTGDGAIWWFNPGFPIPEENIELSHLTKADLAKIAAAPSFREGSAELFCHLQRAKSIIGQHAACDVQALWSSYLGPRACSEPVPKGWRQQLQIFAAVVDTLPLYWALLPDLADHKAGTVAAALGIRVDEATAHTAEADCRTSIATFQAARRAWAATPEGREMPWVNVGEIYRFHTSASPELALLEMKPSLVSTYGAALGAVRMDMQSRVGKTKGKPADRGAAWCALQWGKEEEEVLGQPWLNSPWKQELMRLENGK